MGYHLEEAGPVSLKEWLLIRGEGKGREGCVWGGGGLQFLEG